MSSQFKWRKARRALAWLVVVVVVAGCAVWSWGWSHLTGDSVARGVAAYRRGDWAAAARLAQQRLSTSQDDASALRLLARASARLDRHPAARAAFARLDPGGLEPEDHFLLGLGWSRDGQFEAARTAWRSALEVDPDHAGALDELARLAMLKAHPIEGAQAARRLAKLPGREARGDLLLGMILAADHDPSGATLALERALRRDPSARLAATEPFSAQKLLARTLLQAGRPAEARATLQTILERGPDREASWLLSRAYLLDGATAYAAAAMAESGTYRAEFPLEAEPSAYVGEARCAGCHPGESKAVLASRHARTYSSGRQLAGLLLPDQPVSDPGDPGVTHAIRRVGDRIQFETRARDRMFRAVVEYALGASDRYLSLVGRDEQGVLRVLRLSRYHNGRESGWDKTKSQPGIPAHLEDFLGKPYRSADEPGECLGCHTTVARSARGQAGPEPADRAIGCESCHGPGGLHLAAVAARFLDPAIVNPARAKAADVNRHCGHCHSQHLLEMPASRADPVWARFPGSTLPQSRCYTESGGSLSCSTCHDPHRDVETSAAYYEGRCLSCHASGTPAAGQAPPSPEAFRSPCPINPSRDCLQCHMPGVRYPTLHTGFTDHYIRLPRAPGSSDRQGR